MKTQPAFFKRLLMCCLQLCCISIHASTYYFSASDGDDGRNIQQAQHAATPWKSLTRLNQAFSSLQPGDSILFKRNDVFPGYLQVSISGSNTLPVIFSAYGTGNDPVITGLSSLSGWSAAGNGIWKSVMATAPGMIHSVLLNGIQQPIGRYPNLSDANSGYLTVQDVPAANSITVQPVPTGNWTGADIVIRKNHWVLDRNQVTAISGNTIQYVSESGYGASKNYGCFFQNSAAALDLQGEWYYDKNAHAIGMYFGAAGPGNAVTEVSTVENLVTINGQSNIVFTNLVFKGANGNAFDISNAGDIRLTHCSILYTGNTGIHATQSRYITIEDGIIDHSNNTACDISNTPNLVIRNNIISNTGTIAGSGKGDSGSYEALLLSGDAQIIEGNTITNTGYIPVTFSGNAIQIRHNFISDFANIKDDGGGIYAWNNSANAPTHTDRTIDGNIILNGLGAPDGTEDKKRQVNGIYMDDNTDHISIRNNSVASCGQYGIFIHNAHDLLLDSNTLFNNQGQAAMIHDNIAASIPVTNISFTNTINFSKTANQPAAIFNSIGDDLPVIGNLDYNFYCRPLNEQASVTAFWRSGGGYYGLADWQQLFNKDAHSRPTPVTIAPYRVTNIISANLYSNGSFINNISNLYAYAGANNCSASWSGNSPLDAGALKLSFSSVQPGGYASVIIGIGSVMAGHTYLLRYDEAGLTSHYLTAYLRKSLSPYNDLSERKLVSGSGTRTPGETLFTATGSETNTSLVLDITDQVNPVYIDNLRLYEVQAIVTNPDDSISFVYNKTASPLSYSLNGGYLDVRGNVYTGSITLPPFRSAVLIKKSLALLPLSVLNFNAVNHAQDVLLTWTLSQQEGLTAQSVERSADGIHFSTLSNLDGLPGLLPDYSFTDTKPAINNYYRIRFVQDGHTTYSKTVYIHFSKDGADKDQVIISPNPAVDNLTVSVGNNTCHPCTLVLQTVTGSKIKAIPLSQPSVTIDISHLSKGHYLLSMISDKQIITRPFEKI